MNKNMGNMDRIIRTVIALVVGVLILTGTLTGLAAVILGIFAVVFLLTSFVSICPLYTVLKISTKPKDAAAK